MSTFQALSRQTCSTPLGASSKRTLFCRMPGLFYRTETCLRRALCQELPNAWRRPSSQTACFESRWPRTSRSRCQASARASAGPIRKLVMMRHADSEDSGNGRDFDRNITMAGQLAARQVAEQLAARGWLPDLIVCSDSTRTQQTLRAMQAAVGALKGVRTLFRGELYITAALDGQTRKHLEDLIADETQDSAVKCVLCLGHNKGWEEAASSFSGRSVRLQPANAALLQGRGVSWQEALHGQAVLDLVELLLPYPAADTAPGTGLPTLA